MNLRTGAILACALMLTSLSACVQVISPAPAPKPGSLAAAARPVGAAPTVIPIIMPVPTIGLTAFPSLPAGGMRNFPASAIGHDALGSYMEVSGEKFRPVTILDSSGNEIDIWTTTHIKNGSLLDRSAAPLLVADPTGQVPDMAPIRIEYQFGIQGPYVEFMNYGSMWGRFTMPNILWNDLQVRFYGEDREAVPDQVIEYLEAVTSRQGLILNVRTEGGSQPWRISRSTGYIVRVVDIKTAEACGFEKMNLPYGDKEILLKAEIDRSGNLVQYVASLEPLENLTQTEYLQMSFFSLARAARSGDLTRESWDEVQMQGVNIYSMIGASGVSPYIEVTDRRR